LNVLSDASEQPSAVNTTIESVIPRIPNPFVKR
jgi:hypothetical protein